MKLRIGQAAKALGVSISTLRRWEKEGKIQAERTPHGHRRCDLAQLQGLKPYQASQTNRPTLCYARVSSQDQIAEICDLLSIQQYSEALHPQIYPYPPSLAERLQQLATPLRIVVDAHQV
jgi:excisionase family DNA binding protein